MRYSYTQVALFALTASALPTNIARDPQLLGGLLDATKDIASAAGSIISPFADATGSIVGGTYDGLKDVAGGVASGIFGYKEKREPQLLGGILDAGYDLADATGSLISPFADAGSSILGGLVDGGKDVVGGVLGGVLGYKEKRDPQILSDVIEAGSDLIGNVASIPGDVLSSLSGYGSDYDEYKKRSAEPQILGSIIETGIDAGKDVLGGVLSIPGSIIQNSIESSIDAGKDALGNVISIPKDVLSSLTGYGSDYDEYKHKRQLLDLFEDAEDIVEEVAEDVVKREANPQLVGSLLGGLTNTVDSLLGGGYGYDEDRYDGPDVVVVTPPAGPPVGYEWKA